MIDVPGRAGAHPALSREVPADHAGSTADALEGQPGSAKYESGRQALLAAHLDVRKKPVEPPPEVPPPPEPPVMVRGRVR